MLACKHTRVRIDRSGESVARAWASLHVYLMAIVYTTNSYQIDEKTING